MKAEFQISVTMVSLNKLDVKNQWVLRDLENHQALSSALASLGRYSPGPSSFLNPVEPWFLTSNYYTVCTLHGYVICDPFTASFLDLFLQVPTGTPWGGDDDTTTLMLYSIIAYIIQEDGQFIASLLNTITQA